jgi:hypothetical protein
LKKLLLLGDTASIKDKASFLNVILYVVLIEHNEDKVKSAQETRDYTSIGLEIVLRVPLLELAWISRGDYGGSGVNFTNDTAFCYA